MILIIDNYDSFTHNLVQLVAQFHNDIFVVRNDKISIAEIKQLHLDGIIISPGPGRPENAGICVELIRALVKEEISVPLLGVCLGHQALTVALGGKVISANEIVHGKSDHIHHSQQGLYSALSSPMIAGRYHSLIAERHSLPKSLCVEAENNQQLIMGIKHVSLPLYGVQFHPESILTPQGAILLREFVAICRRRSACY